MFRHLFRHEHITASTVVLPRILVCNKERAYVQCLLLKPIQFSNILNITISVYLKS